jgi:CRISPR-associated protein Csb1
MTNPMLLNRFDSWLASEGPVAAAVREELQPVEGDDAVFFPPTFAPPQKGEAPKYVIDDAPDGKTVIVDTVGSQANRLEPLFKKEPLSRLVPRAVVKVGEREINLLDVGHRAADAVVRFSSRRIELRAAFQAIADSGNAQPLAKLAPTSLVFGAWDSRDTQVKLPRLIASRIRAYDVAPMTRSAQYFAAFEKEETEGLKEALGLSQDALSELGFSDAPAGFSFGGVIARKGIRREATLNLIALRALGATDEEGTRKIQRYILGLSLVVLLADVELYLRQGCLLVTTGNGKRELVFRDNRREDLSCSYGEAVEFAQTAAADFGVGPDWEASFSKEAAVEGLGATKSAQKAKKAKDTGKEPK